MGGESFLGFIATIVGAAQGANDDVVATLVMKRKPGGGRGTESEALPVEVGQVSAKLDAARTLLQSLADRADAGGSFTLAERAALTRTGAVIVTLPLESIDKFMELAGTPGFGTTAVVQQAWRDVHFAAAHISLGRRDTFGRYGRMLLDVEDKIRACPSEMWQTRVLCIRPCLPFAWLSSFVGFDWPWSGAP